MSLEETKEALKSHGELYVTQQASNLWWAGIKDLVSCKGATEEEAIENLQLELNRE